MEPDHRPLPVSSLIKIPRQRRSVDMAHLILDAAIIVLQGEGVIGFNTNRVAEVAGVSVGTLYQYFANKEMLVAGIVERGILDSEALLRQSAAGLPGAGPREIMTGGLRVIIAHLNPYRVLLREILQITPYASATGVIPLVETRISDLLRDWLSGVGLAYQPVGGRGSITVLTRAAIYVTLRHLAEPNPPDDDTFIEAASAILAAGITAC